MRFLKHRLFTVLILISVLCFSVTPVNAQDTSPDRPVYVVQDGDSLFSIALKFGVTVQDIIDINQLANPDLLSAGMELAIPGLEGISGKLVTETITLGETLRTLSIRHQIAPDQIMRLNRITSPTEVYAGASLVIPQQEDAVYPQVSAQLDPGISLMQMAIANNQNPWLLAETNYTGNTWDWLPGESIFSWDASDQAANLISPEIVDLQVAPLPLVQGFTASVKITTRQPMTLTGSLAGNELHFFSTGENNLVALQGIHAMAEPGIYSLLLQGTLPDGKSFNFEQMVVLQSAGYAFEDINGVDPQTMDPAITKPENDQVYAVVQPSTPEKYWDGIFQSPGYDPNWITSWFGTRRSYNDSPYSFFHTGIDYGGGTGLPIKAPAAGIVVFASPLTVRGNATIIDHGWGVYSGFWHQSEIQVSVGDRVETGQVIGLVGGTGRITGPHLHWEIWVNGVNVNPFTWLEQSYP